MYPKIKRGIDFVLSLCGIVVLSPLLLVLALLVKTSRGPVLFKQKRVGKDKTFFEIYKFRSMYADTPKDVPTHLLDNPDRLITPVGKFLRRTSLDELPQLFNVLRGEMSLIGPRPLVWTEREMRLLRRWYGVYQVRPGITGLAQVSGRDLLDNYEKLHLDREYLRRLGPAQDLHLACRTVRTVVSRAGYREGRAAAPAPVLEV